jgi:hypothetical protein
MPANRTVASHPRSSSSGEPPGGAEPRVSRRLAARPAGRTCRSGILQAVTAVTLTLVFVWAATQLAAAMLGQKAALGTPWISLGSVAVYAPWKLFAWWMAFDARAPQVFRRAGLLAIAAMN